MNLWETGYDAGGWVNVAQNHRGTSGVEPCGSASTVLVRQWTHILGCELAATNQRLGRAGKITAKTKPSVLPEIFSTKNVNYLSLAFRTAE
jgi:hypothetical protein